MPVLILYDSFAIFPYLTYAMFYKLDARDMHKQYEKMCFTIFKIPRYHKNIICPSIKTSKNI